jgi:hypothetical protein
VTKIIHLIKDQMEKKNIIPLEKSKIPLPGNNSTPPSPGCCGGTPANNADACCKLDEDKKAEGEEGCGCNTTKDTARKSSCC